MFKIEFSRTGKTVDCRPDQTVLEAAQAAGIDIPFSCQGGTCHTCAVKGSGEMETEEMLALTPPELAEGWRLTCVAYPRGNCRFEA
jgi:2Fe-2S type ferredoxin